ncbi:MAG: formamidopyrimidine-DNA glycosylase [Acidimicrobiia bacterium]|nr:formamidopyrimidine-DNA glycosylase [Acidimicrobiia bacterium]
MPELPDIVVYIEALETRVVGEVLRRFRVTAPQLLRTYDPPMSAVEGQSVRALRRIGKRIVFEFDEELFLVVHLMISGRLAWAKPGAVIPRKVGLAALDFEAGTLLLREAATKKRAGVWIVRGEEGLAEHDRGGVEPLDVDLGGFADALTRENRTLKRALTDPRIFSGIGNAYSDEILHAAQLSPVKRTSGLAGDEIERLFTATQRMLIEWTDRLREESAGGFPDKGVTAFRVDMAVHGKYGQPCPVCGSKVQRIVYAANETNYCATCQTGGKLLADRSLSRLLKGDWPKTLEELEERE